MHTTADDVNVALAAGFRLRRMAEISDPPFAGQPAAPPQPIFD